MLKIVIPTNPITKKNHQNIVMNKATGRRFVLPSEQYRQYEQISGYYIPNRMRIGIDMPVNVKCLYYLETKRKCDLVNLLEATDDILVKYGVLKDDNSNIIVSHDGSRVRYDKNNPRVEIYISAAADDVAN